MTRTPTDALRLVPEKDVTRAKEWLNGFAGEKTDTLRAYIHQLEASAPASPLPGGGPTCQLCASKIEGWICQGCGSHFYENDAGALVLNNIPAAPTGDARNGKGEG